MECTKVLHIKWFVVQLVVCYGELLQLVWI